MDFEWVAIALGDVAWIGLAFAFGMFARTAGLPPLVGYLATGFLLHALGIDTGDTLEKLADLGITLLLFTVGLKLNLRSFSRPQVWAVTGLHMAATILFFGLLLRALAFLGLPLVGGLDNATAFLLAFSLSFSSTVFAVKALEDRGEMRSLHGTVAIGILVVQDLIAVGFLALSNDVTPNLWCLSLLLLPLIRPWLLRLLDRVGHGELLVLYAFVLALGGAEWFEVAGLKGDLGALVLGVFVASHARSTELARTMLGFKDLFLLGFFLSIGMTAPPTLTTFVAGILIAPLVLTKTALFLWLLSMFRLRARTALLASLRLTNYSEFGLIVIAVSAANGWLDEEWLVAVSIGLALSFVIAAILNKDSSKLYARYRGHWQRLQKSERLADDPLLSLDGTRVLVLGMGRVGTGAYDQMREHYGDSVVGVDSDAVKVQQHQASGRRVLTGDPGDADFWDRVVEHHTLELALLALPTVSTSLAVLKQLREAGYEGRVAATARYADDIEALRAGGADTVFNIYTEAGAGFAAHVTGELAIGDS